MALSRPWISPTTSPSSVTGQETPSASGLGAAFGGQRRRRTGATGPLTARRPSPRSRARPGRSADGGGTPGLSRRAAKLRPISARTRASSSWIRLRSASGRPAGRWSSGRRDALLGAAELLVAAPLRLFGPAEPLLVELPRLVRSKAAGQRPAARARCRAGVGRAGCRRSAAARGAPGTKRKSSMNGNAWARPAKTWASSLPSAVPFSERSQ